MTGQILPLTASPGSDLSPALFAKLRGKAQEFEATTLGQLLQPMFDTVDTSKDLFSGGSAEEQWKPMMVSEIAKQISKAGGIGLAQPVLQSLLQAQEAGAHPGRPTGGLPGAPAGGAAHDTDETTNQAKQDRIEP